MVLGSWEVGAWGGVTTAAQLRACASARRHVPAECRNGAAAGASLNQSCNDKFREAITHCSLPGAFTRLPQQRLWGQDLHPFALKAARWAPSPGLPAGTASPTICWRGTAPPAGGAGAACCGRRRCGGARPRPARGLEVSATTVGLGSTGVFVFQCLDNRTESGVGSASHH
jgi:hypothetical protein